MRDATRTVAAAFGITAGISGTGHGVYEILQGNTKPDGVVISSNCPPRVPDHAWNACEPTTTIIPNFLISRILSIVFDLTILILSTLQISVFSAYSWDWVLANKIE